jgi:hypothetical protein
MSYPFTGTPVTPWFTNKQGQGTYVQGQTSVSTSASLGNQLLRLTPLIVTTAFTLTQLGAELVTAGDAPTLIAMAWYGDDGTGYPGSLISAPGSISTGTGNAGTIATAGTPGVYMIPLATPVPITPGLYWLGGVVQGVSSVQPTMRTGSFGTQFAAASAGVPGVSASQLGYTQSSVSGALPATFNTFASAGSAGTVARTIFRVQ